MHIYVMILVTNDDGYTQGLLALLEAAKEIDDAYAIIPSRQRSAVGSSATLHKPLRLHEITEGIYEINGNPSDCVWFALASGEFEPPTMVFSGINYGDNTALSAITMSGTLGACFTGAVQDIPGLAFSLYRKDRDWRRGWPTRDKMKDVVLEIYEKIKPKIRPGKILSVNFPESLHGKDIIYNPPVQRNRYELKITKRLDPYNTPYFWVWGVSKEPVEGTDLYYVSKGYTVINEFDIFQCYDVLG